MSLLQVEGLCKSFGGLQAVDDVSFRLEAGEILGLIGPNGAGKTTLFNLVAGTIKPDRGRAIFSHQDLTGLSPHQICHLGIARTFQVTRPFLNLTCAENVIIPMISRRPPVSKEDRPRLVSELLDFVGLGRREQTMAKDLNLIDKKRLEMARALATGPRLILLDEVLGGLSSLEMDSAMDLIRHIRSRFNITILWIEHVMGAIMTLCERVLVLDQGRFIVEGSPEQVTTDPKVIQAYLGDADAQD